MSLTCYYPVSVREGLADRLMMRTYALTLLTLTLTLTLTPHSDRSSSSSAQRLPDVQLDAVVRTGMEVAKGYFLVPFFPPPAAGFVPVLVPPPCCQRPRASWGGEYLGILAAPDVSADETGACAVEKREGGRLHLSLGIGGPSP